MLAHVTKMMLFVKNTEYFDINEDSGYDQSPVFSSYYPKNLIRGKRFAHVAKK